MNSDQRENRFLKTLDWADFDLLAPHLRQVSLKQGSLLQEQEAPVQQVYFPSSGVISLISVMEGGEVVETATVGREGAVGAFGGLGPWRAFTRAVVQLPGRAAVISVAPFQTAVSQSNQLRNLILRYKEAMLAQVQQTAACNALHPLEARLARWLLQTLDRADGAELPLTQDQKEIAALRADKSVPEADKQEDIAQLETALKIAKPIQFRENIALVLKYFDQLVPITQEQDSKLRPAD